MRRKNNNVGLSIEIKITEVSPEKSFMQIENSTTAICVKKQQKTNKQILPGIEAVK